MDEELYNHIMEKVEVSLHEYACMAEEGAMSYHSLDRITQGVDIVLRPIIAYLSETEGA